MATLPAAADRHGWRRASGLVGDWAPFALLRVAYALMRDAARRIDLPRPDLGVLERTLLGGREPSVVLQGPFNRSVAHRPWRRSHRHQLGVVLSGGAAVGAFQAGVIDALARRGVVPDLIVGTSIGAINGAYWASDPGPDAGQRLLRLWLQSGASRPALRGFPVLRHLVTGRGYIADNLDLRRLIAGALGDSARIEASQVPLAIVATEASSGRHRVLRTGPLLPALLASSAVPGIFPPVVVDGEPLVDGGVVANCDVEAAVEAGMTDVLAVDLLGEEDIVGSHVWDVVQHAVGVSLKRQTDLGLQALAGRARVALLRPRIVTAPAFGDLRQTASLYELGRRAGERFLDAHLTGARTVRPGTLTYAAESELTRPAARAPGVPGSGVRSAAARRRRSA